MLNLAQALQPAGGAASRRSSASATTSAPPLPPSLRVGRRAQQQQQQQQPRHATSARAHAGSSGAGQGPHAGQELHVPLGMDLASYPSLEGRNVLITGAARGLGMCTARLLAHLGAAVYLADVDAPALAAAVQRLRAEVPGAQLHQCAHLDLGQQGKVLDFVDWWSSQGVPLHVLVNNAGANFMGVDPWFTDQGVAGLPQVNYLGPMTLTLGLSSCLEAAAAASGRRSRIVNVCSVMHRFSRLPEDPQFFLRDWWSGGSYRNCKLALTMTGSLLQERLGGRGVDCVSVDPGAVYSGIWSTSRILGRPPGSTVIRALFATPEDACATGVHAAATPLAAPGAYYARGLFAGDAVAGAAAYEPLAAALSCVDWPLRAASSGAWASRISAVPVAPHATQLLPARKLWDACTQLIDAAHEQRRSTAASKS